MLLYINITETMYLGNHQKQNLQAKLADSHMHIDLHICSVAFNSLKKCSRRGPPGHRTYSAHIICSENI